MASQNFERCLAITLKWEGGYSNHPDDPGGPTMRGIIQREYDTWRKKWGKRTRPVRQIEEAELRAIYRAGYWDAMECDNLAAGMDLCVFDAAVNSGVQRARAWLGQAHEADAFCDARMAFLRGLGRLWRVFGAGWTRRVTDIRNEAHLMTGGTVPLAPHDASLHAGMRGDGVLELQRKLRALGYPAGAIDGVFGEQTYRAVVLFQTDHDLKGDAGVWQPEYDSVLATAQPMLPKRQEAGYGDLARQGDRPVQRLNLMQRLLVWLFGASAVAQVSDADSIMGALSGFQGIVAPAMGVLSWLAANRWLLIAGVLLGMIFLVRFMRARHVEDYKSFTYQGDAQ